MKSNTKMIAAIMLMVITWRFKYAFAPSWTAAEICRIRSLPDEERLTIAIKLRANTSPITAQTIESGTPASTIVRPNKMRMNVRAESLGLSWVILHWQIGLDTKYTTQI